MNRTGLLLALGIGVLTGLVFGVAPWLDREISARFLGVALPAFPWRMHPLLAFMRDAAMWIVTMLAAPAVVGLALKVIAPRLRLPFGTRAALFLVTTLALAPGLVANVILKENWSRPRPIDIAEFGGSEHFVAWWDPRGDCPKNCSFVSGDVAGAFWTLAPAAIAPPAWRGVAYGAALAFGTTVAFLRVLFGAHFTSDVLFAGVFTFLVIWFVHGVLFRFGRTRMSDEAIDAWMASRRARIRTAFLGIFRRDAAAQRPPQAGEGGRRARPLRDDVRPL